MGLNIVDIDGTTQAPGSAAPGRGVQVLGQDGTDSRVLLVDASGRPLVTVATPLPTGDNRIGRVKLTDDTNVLNVPLQGDSLAAGNAVPVMGRDNADAARFLLTDDEGRLAVTPSPPTAPPGTTEFVTAVNEAELDVGSGGDVASPHTTLGPIIGNGVNLFLQLVESGTEGDSSENGSVVEIYWRTSGPVDHLIERIYIAGSTVTVTLPNTNKARDGTTMTGDGVDTRLVVIRRRLSVSALEIDFVVRGYTE